MTGISIEQVRDVNAAIGFAVTYVAAHQPFGAYRADKLIGSIVGQIHRGHYAFAVENGVIVGFIGWALCSPDIARAWIEEGQAPRSEQCLAGDVAVPVFIVSNQKPALRALVKYARELYRGKRYLARRASRNERAVRKGTV
ncbi:hypothetical protein AB4Y85_06005 [Microvirga sp. 2YAF29]|uniref:hypothetical protein n=1 Tax=Microvirga sp. 2YAF29 TaxID=3233031 RepID=UPI003F978A50